MYTYQRTPAWILPRSNGPVTDGMKATFRSLPAAQLATRGIIYATTELLGLGFRHPSLMKPLQRLALGYLEKVVPDPALRAKLTPSYTLGCKRILFSNRYYQALSQPNVEVVTDGIREVTPRGIVSADGRERKVDAIVFGTGFEVTNTPFSQGVRGRGGRTLAEAWNGSPQAHLGTTVSGYPNFFIILGPNTGLGQYTSVVLHDRGADREHVVSALLYMRKNRVAAVEPRAEAQAAFIADVDRRLGTTVWNQGGCASWYIDKTGRNSTLWPDATWRYRRRVRTFDASEYVLSRHAPRPARAPSRKAQPATNGAVAGEGARS